ncbi:hypothetical protein ES703_34675 [subsurface metagenome]
MGRVADPDPAIRVDAVLSQGIQLFGEGDWVHHHAVSQDADTVGMEDARGDLMKDDRVAVDLDGMAGIGAPLVAGCHVHVFTEQIDEFALALVAPLPSYDSSNGHGYQSGKGNGFTSGMMME